jgi:uncharacterized membrane protein
MEKRNNNDAYRLKWTTLRREWPLWIFMVGVLVASIIIYPHLPVQVPGHWNIKGEVDKYYPRAFGAFFAPLMAIGIYLLMLIIPSLDPRRENYIRFTGAYTFLRWGLVLFLSVLHVTTILVALGYSVNVALVVKAMVAILLTVIGNFMGQFRHNYFVGIRTPWTLANEEVWQRTHRVGGRIWVIGGLICLIMAPFHTTWSAIAFFTIIMIMTFIPIVYSYLVFRKLQNS